MSQRAHKLGVIALLAFGLGCKSGELVLPWLTTELDAVLVLCMYASAFVSLNALPVVGPPGRRMSFGVALTAGVLITLSAPWQHVDAFRQALVSGVFALGAAVGLVAELVALNRLGRGEVTR